MDQMAGDETHPLMGLLDIVGTLISDYERRNIPEPEGTPLGCLKIFDGRARVEAKGFN